MSMCRVFSCVVGRGCLLWQAHSLGKTILAFVLLHLYSKAKFACYSRCFLTSYFWIPVPYNEKDIFYWVLVLKGLVGLHKTVQPQFLQHYWSGHGLGLLWYWMVCLGHERNKCKKAKWPSVEALQIVVKRREVKIKGEEERYTHLNAEFWRRARGDKKAFLSDQCKEIEENNGMGKTRDLLKKIRDTNGKFHAKMGSIKDRNGMDLTEAEDIKKRSQEQTEELYKKIFTTQIIMMVWSLT